ANASDDLPEPESPVTTIRLSRGISSEMFLRLWTRAPCTAIVVRAVFAPRPFPPREAEGVFLLRRFTVELEPIPWLPRVSMRPMCVRDRNLGTHRFQRAGSAKDALIGIKRPGSRLACFDRSLLMSTRIQLQARFGPPMGLPSETARWKRCVPRLQRYPAACNSKSCA